MEDRIRAEAAIPYNPKVGSTLSICIGLPNCYRCKITWNLDEFRTSVIPFCQYMPYIVVLHRLWQSGTLKYVDFSLMTEDTKKSSALSENRVPWVTHRVADLLFWGPIFWRLNTSMIRCHINHIVLLTIYQQIHPHDVPSRSVDPHDILFFMSIFSIPKTLVNSGIFKPMIIPDLALNLTSTLNFAMFLQTKNHQTIQEYRHIIYIYPIRSHIFGGKISKHGYLN